MTLEISFLITLGLAVIGGYSALLWRLYNLQTKTLDDLRTRVDTQGEKITDILREHLEYKAHANEKYVEREFMLEQIGRLSSRLEHGIEQVIMCCKRQ